VASQKRDFGWERFCQKCRYAALGEKLTKLLVVESDTSGMPEKRGRKPTYHFVKKKKVPWEYRIPLKELREAKKLNTSEFGRLTDVYRCTIIFLEAGKKTSECNIRKIVEFLGIEDYDFS
jgi:DNA-binding XRE family transcriptional regulator